MVKVADCVGSHHAVLRREDGVSSSRDGRGHVEVEQVKLVEVEWSERERERSAGG